MTTNAVLAEQLHAQADDAMHHRKILLCASVALTETNTAAAAVKVLGDWHGARQHRGRGDRGPRTARPRTFSEGWLTGRRFAL